VRRQNNLKPTRILSIAFASKRLGFVVADSRKQIIDYGTLKIPKTDKVLALKRVHGLIELFNPNFICIQNIEDSDCRLGNAVKIILRELESEILKKDVALKAVTKGDVWGTLGLTAGSNKQRVAEVTQNSFIHLKGIVSQKRNPWESEHRNSVIFIAASMAFTLY